MYYKKNIYEFFMTNEEATLNWSYLFEDGNRSFGNWRSIETCEIKEENNLFMTLLNKRLAYLERKSILLWINQSNLPSIATQKLPGSRRRRQTKVSKKMAKTVRAWQSALKWKEKLKFMVGELVGRFNTDDK